MAPSTTAWPPGITSSAVADALRRLQGAGGVPVIGTPPEEPVLPQREAAWSYDPAEQRMTRLDPGVASLFLTSYRELLAEPGRMARAVHADDLPALAALFISPDDVLAQGREFWVRTREGERRLHVRAARVRDADGRVIRVDGLIRMVEPVPAETGGQERRYQDLLRSLRLKQLSVDRANDALIWTEPDGRIIDCNHSACRLYGADRLGLLAATVFDLNPAFTPEIWRGRWDALRTSLSEMSETTHRRLDGETFPVLVSTNHLEFGGREYHCTIIRDLTEQKLHEAEIRRMQAELEARVEERSQALDESRTRLLESEKMAALGRLVAGVTHEINTPVGIGVTAASHLQDLVRKLDGAYGSQSMTRADFEDFLHDAHEAAGMILSNLNKASRLIQGFKGVAVDQSDDARREFELAGYLEEILLSLRPRLKRAPVQVELDCPAGLVVDSYPGALSQAVSNLIMNSLIHGFAEGRSGRIRIAAEAVGDDIRLTYADDGAGMTEDVKDKLYEPFFTTRRGQGGSGLGMHVVYTAVTGMLDGRIACESAPGQGVTFRITFPRTRRRDDV
ncbi:MAG TPA: ATP-binding protein [Candidatus Krumholzibacteria bacterium]|nr:ATP-binding protein [Candidatus Krumholzibacteria bacterium]